MDKRDRDSLQKRKIPLLKAQDLCKSFQGSNGTRLKILNRLGFEAAPAETVAVVGASGIGKSTLLHILGTLDQPDSGALFFGDQSLFDLDEAQLARFRNRSVGFVFQFHHLLAEFTALENTMMPLLIQGQDRKTASRAAEAILVRVGLQDRLGQRVPRLSGGEQQRVALARALVHQPPLLLADEPTGNLDRKNSEQVHKLLLELNQEFGMTLVVVTHNSQLAAYMSRRVTLSEGQLAEMG